MTTKRLRYIGDCVLEAKASRLWGSDANSSLHLALETPEFPVFASRFCEHFQVRPIELGVYINLEKYCRQVAAGLNLMDEEFPVPAEIAILHCFEERDLQEWINFKSKAIRLANMAA